jgi:hypothetical protein
MARKFYTPINLTGLELQNFKVQNLPDNPTAYGKGHAYYNTAHNELRIYDGSAWNAAGGSVEFGTYSDIPTYGNAGRLYATTDTQTLFLDTGSSWLQIGDPTGAASTAESNAKSYADGLAGNYDPAGAASTAQSNAESYADGLAGNYDPAGAASTAQSNAETYADGLAINYDPAGAASTAQSNAESYTDTAITNLHVGGTNSGDVATRGYVDATAQGLSIIGSVRAASDAALDLTGTTPVVGGVALADGDRVLVKDQAIATENGIYLFNSTTSKLVASTNPEDTDLKEGSFAFVEEGTSAARGYIITSYVAGSSTWTQFSAAGEYTGGDGIDISGTTISAKVADGLKIDGSGNIAVDTGKVVYKYATTITGDSTDGGVTGTTQFTVTHNLGTLDIQVVVYDTTTNEEVVTDLLYINTTSATVGFAVAPVTTQSYRVVVQA